MAYQGDAKTGEPVDGLAHEHHIWNVDKVRALVADQGHAASLFCGGSRNFSSFIDLFDQVFVLKVDLDTLSLSTYQLLERLKVVGWAEGFGAGWRCAADRA